MCRTNFFQTALRNTFAGYHVNTQLSGRARARMWTALVIKTDYSTPAAALGRRAHSHRAALLRETHVPFWSRILGQCTFTYVDQTWNQIRYPSFRQGSDRVQTFGPQKGRDRIASARLRRHVRLSQQQNLIQTCPKPAPNLPKTCPKPAPNRSKTCPKHAPNPLQTRSKPAPKKEKKACLHGCRRPSRARIFTPAFVPGFSRAYVLSAS